MNEGKKLIAAFAGAVTLVAAGITGIALMQWNKQYSEGSRVGTVSKFSYKGLLDGCKSWEGELAMDNFKPVEGGGTSNTFAFSVVSSQTYGTDEKGQKFTRQADVAKLVEQLKAAQKSGERVELDYSQVFKSGSCNSDSDYYAMGAAKTEGQTKAPTLKP